MSLHSQSPAVSRIRGAENAVSQKGSLNLDSANSFNSPHVARKILVWVCWLFAKFSKQNPRHASTVRCARAHKRHSTSSTKTFSHYGLFGAPWLTECTCSNMCPAWAALPVNRLPTAQTENMYSSLGAVVGDHWLACSKCFHSPLTF